MSRKSRMTREQKAERFRATRDKWAATLPAALRCEFDRLLDEADVLVDRGWQMRVAAFELARVSQEVQA